MKKLLWIPIFLVLCGTGWADCDSKKFEITKNDFISIKKVIKRNDKEGGGYLVTRGGKVWTAKPGTRMFCEAEKWLNGETPPNKPARPDKDLTKLKKMVKKLAGKHGMKFP